MRYKRGSKNENKFKGLVVIMQLGYDKSDGDWPKCSIKRTGWGGGGGNAHFYES